MVVGEAATRHREVRTVSDGFLGHDGDHKRCHGHPPGFDIYFEGLPDTEEELLTKRPQADAGLMVGKRV